MSKKLNTFVKNAKEILELPPEVRELVLDQAQANGEFEEDFKEKEKRKQQINQAVDYLKGGD